jgi:hypothetical protein
MNDRNEHQIHVSNFSVQIKTNLIKINLISYLENKLKLHPKL